MEKKFLWPKNNFLSDAINLICDEEIIGRDIYRKLYEIFLHSPKSVSLNEFKEDSEIIFFTNIVEKSLFNECKMNKKDLIDYDKKKYFFSNNSNKDFIYFLRRYGIRLAEEKYKS